MPLIITKELYCDDGPHAGQYFVVAQGYLTAEELQEFHDAKRN